MTIGDDCVATQERETVAMPLKKFIGCLEAHCLGVAFFKRTTELLSGACVLFRYDYPGERRVHADVEGEPFAEPKLGQFCTLK